MGAYSTPRLEEPQIQRALSTASGNRGVAVVARVLGWLFFVGGLVGAGLGLAGLHVEITVAGLILACTAGLILLKLRTDRDALETN
ncbi:hypothetical protein [Nocardia sp. SSK8]|uniref:hypothetical protein n=1 Tax=Nocardia sp. SSK8 TaxID=3120154 RepID=UPI00300B6E3E